MLNILPPCAVEIARLPDEVRCDLADAVARLEVGLMLTMPLSRPMPSMGRGVHELRLKDRSGAYRVVYALRGAGVVLVHAFKKTTREIPPRHIRTARRRLREIA